MTTITATPVPQSGDFATSTTSEVEKAPLSLQVRRFLLVASPVLAAVFALVGTIADPASGVAGSEMNRIYTDNPGPLQVKSLAFHWSYAFWIAPALLLARYVRGKGAWIANVAAALGFTGMTTLPGLLFIDWVDSSIGQLHGVAAIAEFHQHVEDTMWGFPLFQVPGILGFLLALPIAALALWRAGLVRWWAPLSVVVGYVAYMAFMATVPGVLVLLVAFTVFAVALERATRTGAVAR